jgi:hypothetical protein
VARRERDIIHLHEGHVAEVMVRDARADLRKALGHAFEEYHHPAAVRVNIPRVETLRRVLKTIYRRKPAGVRAKRQHHLPYLPLLSHTHLPQPVLHMVTREIA